jgi:hypothetical protein
MNYSVNIEDLYGHNNVIDYYDTLEEAREAFISWCWTPAEENDDFLELVRNDADGFFEEDLDDFQFTRLDRDD